MVDDKTTPPYCSVYGGTSVPPPEKLTRRGARDRIINSEVSPRGSSQKPIVGGRRGTSLIQTIGHYNTPVSGIGALIGLYQEPTRIDSVSRERRAASEGILSGLDSSQIS
jgi:hypothetical protein